ncbi:NUDIX domain-containing protein [Candidatus Roizmanbacteria bacterium]|nr:NUDIX domain-containing protein [Candidatus Roizmanbacteria bacterium]
MKQGIDYIGVTCVFYCHDGKGNLLLHKRSQMCRDEKGRWDCGGGAMKFGETFEQTVRREVKEEYDCKISKLNFVGINNVVRNHESKKTHWIAILFTAEVNPDDVKIGVPAKMEKIGWFKPNKLPKPLHSMFLTHLQFVKDAGII